MGYGKIKTVGGGRKPRPVAPGEPGYGRKPKPVNNPGRVTLDDWRRINKPKKVK